MTLADQPLHADFDVSPREALLLGLALGWAAQRRGVSIGLVESCTGGLAASWVTRLAGSSAWFEAGLVTYSNAMKTRLVGVPTEALAQEGAVSEVVARAMARGLVAVLQPASPQVCVAAITGVAGPTGGSTAKPVGTVWFGWAGHDHGLTEERAQRVQFAGERIRVQRQSAWWALAGLTSWLMAKPPPVP
ncbi:MAG: CinA family protein [Burkholderiaceae bacterium]